MRIDEAEALETGAWNEIGGRKLSEGVRGAEVRTATSGQTKSEDDTLMERVVERENMRQAHAYVQSGRHWVVDMDLEKFFDRVNHDVLMARVARQVRDKRVLKLIRRFLEAGMMADGLTQQRTEGTPQGGPPIAVIVERPAD